LNIAEAEAHPALPEALSIIDDVVRFVGRRRRCTAEEAEELAAEARLHLIEDDYRVLRSYTGRSSLRTFLVVVMDRLLVDLRRHRWGVWRPSAEAARLGPAAVRLDEMLHRDGMALGEALEALRREPRIGLAESELREMAGRLPARVRRREEGEDALARLSVSPDTVEDLAFADRRQRRREELRRCLRSALESFSDEEALIVRLHFSEGMTIARIARSLGVEQKPLYRRIERLVAKLRGFLESSGFHATEASELMEHSAWDEGGELAP
jgi:RNA polymerase sigma factor (sigma-70 family)